MENKSNILIIIISSLISILLISAGILLNLFTDLKALVYIAYILASISLLIDYRNIYLLVCLKRGIKHSLSIKQMVIISIQSALTVILYYFLKFNLPFFPPWLDIQVSEVPALITSFIYGPTSGLLVLLIRLLIKLPNTITLGVGEIADFLIGAVLIISSGLIYKKNKTFKGAIIASVIGLVLATIFACISNWLFLIPAYVNIAGFSYQMLADMLSYIPGVTVDNFMLNYIFIGVLPFNIFRYILVFVITFILYKRIHKLFNKLTDDNKVEK